MSTRLVPWLLLLCLLAPAGALADDDDDGDGDRSGGSDATPCINLPSGSGLAGFQDMIDARSPGSTFSIRGGVRYVFQLQEQDFNGSVKLVRERARHDLTLYAGGSAFGFVDVAARLPYVIDRDEFNRSSLSDLVDDDYGWGDFDFAGKVSLSLGSWITVAPYLLGRFPTGEPAVRDLLEFEYGAAGTVSLLNDYIGVHGNLAGLQREKGLSALRYRLGASFVLFAERFLRVRAYGYVDGIEFGGRANSDVDLDFGLQAIAFEFVSLELGTSVRVLDSGHLDDDVKKNLRDVQGVYDRHFSNEGTWSIQAAIGVVF